MIAYAESSAVLAWILGEPASDIVQTSLAAAERVTSSALTAVECARALARGVAVGRFGRTEELAALRLLDDASASWVTLDLSSRVLSRARAPFPVEPVRTLDALHLATALAFREALPSLTVVSLDERVRANARDLGLPLLP
ncbi:MAG: type II toxin-antitoxin system VapC family toxin [Longimicrobiales bacterium]|nr:type II toxin-antitoxin system VapC family toxin [Longimicrobiales bacterium]